ncbi:MAG: hypothetical protein HQM09_18435 [Candidatus Riflebacteria bacterium]|nr:hypothetical protein [Candidatus Riflebacteria bacterium]
MTPTLLLLFCLSLCCDVTRQMCFKFGADDNDEHDNSCRDDTELVQAQGFQRFSNLFARLAEHLKGVFSSRFIWLGMAICVIEIILWLLILAIAPLNVAYPIMSLDFCFVLLAGRFIFGENVSMRRWIGALFITIGVVLVGTSGL